MLSWMPWSADRRPVRALCGGFLGRASVQDCDMDAGLQLVLSVDDDLLVGLEAGVYERLALADLRDLNRADRHGAVRIDHVCVGSLRALQDDRCGNGQAVMPPVEEQTCVDELTRPQQMLLVRKLGSQPDGARGLDDLVVDQVQRALIELFPVLPI